MTKKFRKEPLLAFLLGFVMFILVFLPELIETGGKIILTGDYNMQSIPFVYHIYDAVHSGNLNWDWSTGLGSQFLSSYAYYNLFSPFTLLYLLFPRSALMTAITFVSALKYGVGAMFAYYYVRRFTENGNYAVIAGLIYMLSSFSGYNLIFHFADVFALFPLLLIALEELCVNNRRGVFALSVLLMALLNYYFFFGQAVFCVIYYFVRCTDRKIGWSWKRLFSVALEAVLGFMMAMALYVPLIAVLLDCSKATGTMAAGDMLVYDSVYYYLKIIQSAFMLPDPINFISMFPAAADTYPYGAVGSSMAAYLPLFSMAGVISYIFAKRQKSWENILLTICAVMAFIPVLNQLFSALNSGFYTRWYYMPLLIASMVSVKALEENVSFKPGIIACGSAVALLLIYNFFIRSEKVIALTAKRSTFSMPENLLHFGVTIINLILLIIVIKQKRDKEFFPKLYIITLAAVYITFGTMCYYLVSSNLYLDENIEWYALDEELPDEVDTSLRTTLSAENTENFNQLWNTESTRYFNSLLPSGFQTFLDNSGMKYPGGLNMDIDPSRRETADLCSVKYLFTLTEKQQDAAHLLTDYGAWYIYENENYIPMGFVYDKVLSEEDFARAQEIYEQDPDTEKIHPNRLYMKYLVVSDPEEYSDILTVSDDITPVSDEEYEELIEKRRSVTCTDLEKTTRGLTARIDLEEENVVFFSVTNCDGWKAYVDSGEAEVLWVNNGLIGVRIPEGTHDIKLEYTIPGLKTGCIISLVGAAGYIAYMVVIMLGKKRRAAALSE